MSGKTKLWLALENFLKLARWKACSTQRPVGVPAKVPTTATLEGRPEDPLITTRT
jgi:hypothetical protein